LKIKVFDNYNKLSEAAGEYIADRLANIPNPLLCFAAGTTPIGILIFLVNAFREDTHLNRANYIGLDEWLGMNDDDAGSCRNTLDNHFFKPLGIENSRIHFFDGKLENLTDQCNRIDRYLEKNGPLDMILLGIGLNGHIGFNEPGASLDSESRLVDLQNVTQTAGQKYFKEKRSLTQGLTLGMKQILGSKEIIMVATGKKKAKIIYELLNSDTIEVIPAAALLEHPNFTLYLDKEAYSLSGPVNP
jgi:glucosamine-6-phosphate isomerase